MPSSMGVLRGGGRLRQNSTMAESFVSTLKRDLIHRVTHMAAPSEPSDGADGAILEYLETFYNLRRRHSALGNLSPSEYEEVRLRNRLKRGSDAMAR